MAKWIVLIALLVPRFAAAAPAPAGGKWVEGVVSANHLNVRVLPGTRYSKVARLSKGDKVRVLRYKDDWYEIAVPADSSVWISSRLVENGFVIKRANLRSGPSVAFSAYRIAEPGERISVIDSSRKDWLKIAPPRGLTAWVSAKYVHLTPKSAAKLSGKDVGPKKTSGDKKAVAVKKTEAKPASPAETPSKTEPPKKGKEPLPFVGDGIKVEFKGKLVKLRSETKYVSYAVAAQVNGEYFPLCYIHAGARDISSFENTEVVVSGLQRFVKGWRRPVLDLASISSASPDAEETPSDDTPAKQ